MSHHLIHDEIEDSIPFQPSSRPASRAQSEGSIPPSAVSNIQLTDANACQMEASSISLKSSSNRRRKLRDTLPSSPLVTAVSEMGFDRKNIYQAIKALGLSMFCHKNLRTL